MQSDDDDQLKQFFFFPRKTAVLYSICYLVMPSVVSPSGTLRFRTRQRPNQPDAKCVQSTDTQRRKELNVMLPIIND
jgi:hypothetical protein